MAKGGRIAGITIEIDADTGKAVKSLSDFEKASRGVAADLRDINKVLKLNPKSTEVLAQKQAALKEKVEVTRKELEAEKEALRQLEQGAQTPETLRQQEALKRQIAETTEWLNKAEKAYKDFGSVGAQQLAAVGRQLKEFGGKVSEVGEELTKKVTAPLLALGGLTIAAFKDVDKGYDAIIKKTGATGKPLEEMQDSFDNLASEIPSDMETIGDAIGEVNTRFGVTGDDLESLAGQFLKFAQINETDVTTAIDSTQKALSAYGLTAQDAGALLDSMNKVGQDTGVSVDKLADGLVANGAAFQELGLSVDQSLVAMGQLEKSGANSETVLTGLRKALKNATAEGKPLGQALFELQDAIENGTDGMDGLTAAYDIFGRSGDQIYNAVKNGSLDFRALGQSAIDAGGSVSETFNATLDPIDQFALAMQELKIVGAEIGATLGEVLVPAMEFLREKIAAVKEWWDQLSPGTQEAIIKVGLLVAAIGPLLVAVGKGIALVGQILTFAPAITTALTALTGPIGAVIAIIAAAIAIGVALYKNWDEIKAWAEQTWSAIAGFFSETWNSIKQKATETWNNIGTTLSQKWSSLKQTASETWSNLKQSAGEAWAAIKEKITQPIEQAKQKVHDVIEAIKGFFKFDWELPKLKLPHISITGKFSINPPSVPHFSIDWYKKAMNGGMILDGATIFGMGANGNFLGGGEAGSEAVVGTGSLQSMIRAAVGDQISPAAIYEAVKQGASEATIRAYLNGKDITAAVNRQNTAASNGVLRFMGV